MPYLLTVIGGSSTHSGVHVCCPGKTRTRVNKVQYVYVFIEQQNSILFQIKNIQSLHIMSLGKGGLPEGQILDSSKVK